MFFLLASTLLLHLSIIFEPFMHYFDHLWIEVGHVYGHLIKPLIKVRPFLYCTVSFTLYETNQMVIGLKLQFLISVFPEAKLKQMNLQEP